MAQRSKTPLEARTDSLVHALQARGIDTICIYEDYCVGCIGSNIKENSPCATKGLMVPTYVFWRQAAKTYRLYLDNCKLEPAAMVKTTMWQYFDKHAAQIKSEEIKEFHVLNKDKTKLSRVTRNHGVNYSYKILIQRDTIEKYYDEFALQKVTTMGNRKMRNIYYRSNRRSPVHEFQLRLADAAAL